MSTRCSAPVLGSGRVLVQRVFNTSGVRVCEAETDHLREEARAMAHTGTVKGKLIIQTQQGEVEDTTEHGVRGGAWHRCAVHLQHARGRNHAAILLAPPI